MTTRMEAREGGHARSLVDAGRHTVGDEVQEGGLLARGGSLEELHELGHLFCDQRFGDQALHEKKRAHATNTQRHNKPESPSSIGFPPFSLSPGRERAKETTAGCRERPCTHLGAALLHESVVAGHEGRGPARGHAGAGGGGMAGGGSRRGGGGAATPGGPPPEACPGAALPPRPTAPLDQCLSKPFGIESPWGEES